MSLPKEDEKRKLEISEDTIPVKSEEPSIARTIFMLFFCFGAGIIFGFASEKGRVFEPLTIRWQMVFKRWIMLKMFLSAMAAGMICLSVLSVIPVSFVRRRFSGAASGYEMALAEKNAVSIGLGAFILGVGMTLSGAGSGALQRGMRLSVFQCPGMVLPQVGTWTHQAIFTLVGALIGSLVYGLLHDLLYEKIFPSRRLNFPSSFTKLTGIKYAYVALPMACAVFGVVIALEVVVKWYNDISWSQYTKSPYLNLNATTHQSAPTIFQLIAWPPSICGTLIGLMQVTIVLAASDTLGGSSSYCTVVSQIICTESLRSRFPYLANFQKGVANWWQVLYVVGAIAGGAISSALSGTIGDVPGVPVVYALFGGFFLLVGARLASGCTSGHGLSGSGLLLLGSFLAVPCMFGGGIAVAFIMQATGQLVEPMY